MTTIVFNQVKETLTDEDTKNYKAKFILDEQESKEGQQEGQQEIKLIIDQLNTIPKFIDTYDKNVKPEFEKHKLSNKTLQDKVVQWTNFLNTNTIQKKDYNNSGNNENEEKEQKLAVKDLIAQEENYDKIRASVNGMLEESQNNQTLLRDNYLFLDREGINLKEETEENKSQCDKICEEYRKKVELRKKTQADAKALFEKANILIDEENELKHR